MEFALSHCRGSWLHKFDIVAEYHFPPDAVKERCSRCGKEIVFKVDTKGNINNHEYLKYHARNALLPQHRLYQHEFPEKHAI